MKPTNHSKAEIPTIPVRPRRSIWEKVGGGSLSISLIVHALLLAGGLIWVFQVIPVSEKEVVWTQRGSGSEVSSSSAQKQRAQMKQISTARRIAIPGGKGVLVQDMGEVGDISPLAALTGGGGLQAMATMGGPNGFGKNPWQGAGLNGGDANQSFFKLLPEAVAKRCSKQDRYARLKENGGTPASDDAVINALRWLKSQQNADGSWGKETRVAMTGLVLLAYFGHCETPTSEEFGDSCMRGIVYLVNIGMKNQGRLATNYTSNHWSYEHPIATYALAEASTFCKEGDVPNLSEVTLQAGQVIIDNQNQDGGWAYSYATEGGHTDVSISGWQIQALKACSHTKLKFQGINACISKALGYINRCQNENGGFGYTGPHVGETGYFSLTGVGMLCNQMWDKGSRSEVRKGAEYILKESRFDYNTEFCDLYAHYYESQAMIQRGGEEWKKYHEMFHDQLINNQEADGSWKTPGGGQKPRATAAVWQHDKLYRTCLCTLMLEVYYRFLNTSGSKRPHSGI